MKPQISSTGPGAEPGYLLTSQAARYCGLSARYLEILRRKGGGPAYIRISPRKCLYSILVLDAWMAERTYRHIGEEGA